MPCSPLIADARRVRPVAAAVLLLCNVPVVPALAQSREAGPRGDPSIIDPTAVLERVFTGAFITEGPAAALDGSIYFSDITITAATKGQAGHIWRYDPTTGRTGVFRSPSGMSNGLTFDSEGRLLAAEGADFGGRRITRTDLATGKSEILAGLFNGRPFNAPNDLTIDTRGRVYFTDPRYLGNEPIEQPVQAVYRIDPDGSVHLIIADAGKPNGIALSPDQRTLYVAIHDDGAMGTLPPGSRATKGRMALAAYDLAQNGSATFRTTLVDFSPGLGPDGLAVDREGNVYVGGAKRPLGIYVYSPTGRELAYIPTPEEPRNAEFGRGAEANMLYITAGGSLYRIRVRKPGYHVGTR